MSTTKLVPNDSRVQNCTANLNGVNYKYMLAMPTGTPKATIFLVHGYVLFFIATWFGGLEIADLGVYE